MRKRIKVERPIATTSQNETKKRTAYKARHEMLDEMAKLEPSKDGMPRYYVLLFGKFEEIPAAQLSVYKTGGFTIVEK